MKTPEYIPMLAEAMRRGLLFSVTFRSVEDGRLVSLVGRTIGELPDDPAGVIRVRVPRKGWRSFRVDCVERLKCRGKTWRRGRRWWHRIVLQSDEVTPRESVMFGNLGEAVLESQRLSDLFGCPAIVLMPELGNSPEAESVRRTIAAAARRNLKPFQCWELAVLDSCNRMKEIEAWRAGWDGGTLDPSDAQEKVSQIYPQNPLRQGDWWFGWHARRYCDRRQAWYAESGW